MGNVRPKLTAIPVATVWPPKPGQMTVTIEEGEWNIIIEICYAAGWVLIEVDEQEQVIRAYQKRPRARWKTSL